MVSIVPALKAVVKHRRALRRGVDGKEQEDRSCRDCLHNLGRRHLHGAAMHVSALLRWFHPPQTSANTSGSRCHSTSIDASLCVPPSNASYENTINGGKQPAFRLRTRTSNFIRATSARMSPGFLRRVCMKHTFCRQVGPRTYPDTSDGF